MSSIVALMGFVPQTTGQWFDLLFMIAAVVSMWVVFREAFRGDDD